MTPRRLSILGAAIRLPLRVFSVLVIAPGRLLFLAVAPSWSRRSGLRSLERECEAHTGPGVRAWWLSRDQAQQAGAIEPVVGVLLRDRR